ncbi:MAG: type II secretion system protein M [Thiotrichales bacterium]|nr:type II secretion system protein M [Thiotrichales bacterium]
MWSQIERFWQPISQRFLPFWQRLAQRERVLLQGLTVLLFWFLLYLLVWQPLQQGWQNAQQQRTLAQQQWQWLNEQIPAWQALESPKQTAALVDRDALMNQVQQSLRERNLQMQLQQIELTTKGVKVVFKSVDAARLFQWLAMLEQQGLVAHRAQIEPLEIGKAQAQIDFQLGN